MQRHHIGSGRRQVIPTDWGTRQSVVVDNVLASASMVTIGPAGGTSAWDEGLGRTITQPANAVYQGDAELMAVSDTARVLLVVEDPTTARVYEVTLPYAVTTVAADMVITVDASDPDPMLAGKTLRVGHIERGSRRFSRVLLAVLID